jgi:hypothetical protein
MVRGLHEGSDEVARVVRSCRVARWLEVDETHHLRIQDQREPLIMFCISRWIQAVVEPLDQNLCVVSCIGGSGVERDSFQLQKSQIFECRWLVRTHGTSIRWGPHG